MSCLFAQLPRLFVTGRVFLTSRVGSRVLSGGEGPLGGAVIVRCG